MLEKDFKKIVMDALRVEGHYVEKIHGGRFNVGLPDILACLKFGKFCSIELKIDDTKATVLEGILDLPTALQLKSLRDAAAAGGLASVMCLAPKANTLFIQKVLADKTAESLCYQYDFSHLNIERYKIINTALKDIA